MKVKTPYGEGNVIDKEHTTNERIIARIQLPWGILYTSELMTYGVVTSEVSDNDDDDVVEAEDTFMSEIEAHYNEIFKKSADTIDIVENCSYNNNSNGIKDFKEIHASIMTSMVVTLGLIDVTTRVFSTYRKEFENKQYYTVLSILESCHWHARSFNEDQSLRHALRDESFMTFPPNSRRSPNLLDQEVNSVSLIIKIAIQLLSHTNNNENGQSTPINQNQNENGVINEAYLWVQKYGTLAVERYAAIQNLTMPADITQAYKPAIICLLSGVLHLGTFNFKHFLPWISNAVCQLVKCDDKDIRLLLSKLMETQVFPFVSYSQNRNNE
jgi:hypothetical protein